MTIDQQTIDNVSQLDAEKRYQYLLDEVATHRQLWILVDEHGSVMLNTEDEDCVPVWPHQAFAEAWATGDWADCKAESISLNKWLSRWTNGLLDDELALVVFPVTEEDGLVLYPDEFDLDLQKANKRKK
ncbi:DUF2750 domain-containing protein [Thaumasiovibrio subtropicus]|uniref:DUF2750 domain-containing protein n=1 Tax=Thaumasiovibrio subtropicus TaxID=1891207 RepID=UPI000B35F0CB|nr:DUF2750 domain-containing protein [Thaumasiovibrio subtropicus]